ncbi:5-formyltetrahydrofolate cyclo-ligase [Chitinophaga vietnamensis]|uniref:5-formyltetrahydrofolate cyclo-ligase n=1 Tax=Chitinophaga vietnamensis TaxID=2593957 RepID=UPI0011778A11|nr:5-formyltetrahydrofolate cyclo-ligase [Chitinophaga vietnamensis]
MTTKKDIRKRFLELRMQLSTEAIASMNAALLANCRLLNYSDIHCVHVFLPITEKREADTWPLIRWMKEKYPHLQWTLSKSDMASGEMTHYLWDDTTVLVNNKYGIPEPAGGIRIQPADIDLVFVPLLAFDRQGHRVGYGKGMYDRFLQQCRADVRTIGLSLFEPVTLIADAGEQDVMLKTAITPDHIYHFTK